MRRSLVYTAIFVIASAAMGMTQGTTARFAGIVQDPSGAVLPGVEASLTNEGTSTVLQSVTNFGRLECVGHLARLSRMPAVTSVQFWAILEVCFRANAAVP